MKIKKTSFSHHSKKLKSKNFIFFLVIPLLIISLAVIHRNRNSVAVCPQTYSEAKIMFDQAKTKENYIVVYEKLKTKESVCGYNSKDIKASIKFIQTEISSAYLAGEEEVSVAIASSSAKWLDSHIKKDQDMTSVTEEYSDIIDFSNSNLPRTVSAREARLSDTKE